MKKQPTRSASIRTLIAATFLGGLSLSTSSLQAQSVWTGGGGADQNWGNAANWGVVPTSSASTVVRLGLATDTAPVVNLNNPWSLRALTFTGNGNVDLTGNALSFTGYLTGTSLGGTSGTGIRTIYNDINATSSDIGQRFTISNAAGGLILNGNLTVDLTGTGIFLIRGAANTTVNGIISGSGGTSTKLGKTDAGTLTLNHGANKISTFTFSQGIIVLGVDNALGSGAALAVDGTNSATLNLNGKNQTLGGLSVVSGATNKQIGNATANPTSTLTYSRTSAAGDDSYSFAIGYTNNNDLNFIKQGSNTLTLTGVNTYTGLTDVQGGTLRYGASNVIAGGAVQVSGGTLDLVTFSDTVGAVTLKSGSITSTTGVLTGTSYAVESGSISAILGGSGSLTKSTAGTVTLSGVNTYIGSTLVNVGTLVVSGTGSINNSSGVTVNGGTLNYSSSTALTPTLTFTSGTLAGTNFSGKTLSIGANQTISPGNSTGTLVSGAQMWAANGTYTWEINDATGTAGGNGWDLLSISGALTITATSVTPFNLNVVSLASQVAGQAANFNSLIDGAWLIADATSAITTFDAGAFNLNLAGFQNAYTGVWSVALGGTGAFGGDSSQIYLTYSAIPEPSTTLLLTGGLMAMLFLRRRARN